MVLLNKGVLTTLAEEQNELLTALVLWADLVSRSAWKSRADVHQDYPKAVFVSGNTTVFALEQCAVTAQIAFNAGLVVVLAASHLEETQ